VKPVLPVLAALFGALALAPTAGSSGAQPDVRTIDRTFACRLVSKGDGTFDLDLVANPRIRQEWTPGDPFVVPAHLIVSSGVDSLDADLVAVRAAPITGISRVQPAGTFAQVRKCRPSRAAVTMSPRGLPYEEPAWGGAVECRAPRRVLVRVRATFAADTAWRKLDANYTGGRAAVIDAAVAVRTETKRSLIAYLALRKSKAASLHYSGRCA
jgi:hypothetical protein